MKGAGWKLWLAIAMLYLLLYGVLVGDKWMTRAINTEQAQVTRFLGAPATDTAYERARRWYRHMFLDTGMVKNSFSLFIPTEAQKKASRGMETLGEHQFRWFDGRLRVFWSMVYQALVRVSVYLLWWPIALILLGAAFMDGMIRRRIKMVAFGEMYPERFGVSLLVMKLGLYVMLVLTFAPFTVPVWLAPGFLALAVLATGVLVANTHKHV
jgi:hypothetical protein